MQILVFNPPVPCVLSLVFPIVQIPGVRTARIIRGLAERLISETTLPDVSLFRELFLSPERQINHHSRQNKQT